MFRKSVKGIDTILAHILRQQGLETPLLQNLLIDSWDEVAGSMAARYTTEKYIRNQTLFVKIQNPALRQDLSMMRSQLVKRLNQAVGAQVIADVRIF